MDFEHGPTVANLISIDYAYFNDSEDYDNGLSFLDRIYAKIGRFHPEWEDINILKNRIQTSDDKESEYMDIINMLFEIPEDIAYYGI